jgi:hypothetical protein
LVTLLAGGDAWLLSLGALTAPAGSTLLLTTHYTARFHHRQGIWRSAPFAPSQATASLDTTQQQQQQVVLLNSAFETNGARLAMPCMDDPKFKVSSRC